MSNPKISQLPTLTSLSSSDTLVIEDKSGATPVTKQVSLQTLVTFLNSVMTASVAWGQITGSIVTQSDLIEAIAQAITNGGGAFTWGDGSGDINNQTDLISTIDQGIIHTKSLTNNADNNLFTFPLASGELDTIEIYLNILVKKGSDWAYGWTTYYAGFYNDGSQLQAIDGSGGDYTSRENKNNSGSVAVDLSPASFSSSLSNNVVTLKLNPGNAGTSPDSIQIRFTARNLTGHAITYL